VNLASLPSKVEGNQGPAITEALPLKSLERASSDSNMFDEIILENSLNGDAIGWQILAVIP
jgi:hypothetical protein